MKFELKTDNENYLKSLSNISKTVFNLIVLIVLCDISLKLGIISRHYQIEYNCILLSTETSQSNFKELSKLSKLKNKRKIWEFCREFID